MTEPHRGKSAFSKYNHTQVPPADDAAIYEKAALIIENSDVYAAILAAGGTQQHINHFSIEKCRSRPIQGWMFDDKITPLMAKDALNEVAEKLRAGG